MPPDSSDQYPMLRSTFLAIQFKAPHILLEKSQWAQGNRTINLLQTNELQFKPKTHQPTTGCLPTT